MNRKASDLLHDTVIYTALVILFLMPVIIFISGQYNGAQNWTDFYVKEIARLIDNASPGDEIILDVHKATEIALGNDIPLRETFTFDNANNEICSKLSEGKRFCYQYFNEVDIIDWKVSIGLGEPQVNTLTFKIKEKAK